MNSWIPSHTQITILQARDLLLKSKSIHSEIFVTVQVDKEKQITHLLPRHSCPVWNQTFDIPLMSLDSAVHITVKQKTKFSEEFIGHLTIPFSTLTISRRAKQNWYKLGPRPGKTNTKLRGDLLLATSFISKWGREESSISSLTTSSNSPINIEARDGRRMLRRSKSEYKSSSSTASNGSLLGGVKDSPKQDKKPKSGGIFGRSLRRKNTQVFEDSDDFLFTYRSSGSPPTPPRTGDRKLMNYSSSLTEDGSVESSIISSSGSDIASSGNNTSHLLFTEATQLERNGIVDLMKADPHLRREQVKQHFRERMSNSVDQSPQTGKKLRPTSMYTPSSASSSSSTVTSCKQQQSLDSSFEEDSSPSNRHSTYRARSTPRRQRTSSISSPRKGGENGDKSLTTQTSNASIDSNTSEYYSGSSSIGTPLNSNSTLNDGMTPPRNGMTPSTDGLTTPTNGSPIVVKKLDNASPSISCGGGGRGLNIEKSDSFSSISRSNREVKLRRGQTMDSSSTLPRLRPQPRPHTDRMSTLQKSRPAHKYSSSDNKRHSADLAQLLKKNSLSSGKDGLENIISSGQVQRFLQQQKGNHGNGDNSSKGTPPLVRDKFFETPPPPPLESPPSSTTTPTETTPTKDIPTDDVSNSEVDSEVAAILNQTTPPTLTSSPSISESLSSELSSCHMTDHTTSDIVMETSAETDSSHVAPPTLNIDSPMSSGSTTPSRLTPPLSSTNVTRETTPSPDHEEIDGSEIVVKEERRKSKHTVELKKSSTGFHPFKPLPPSVASNSSSNSSIQRKYSSTTDITLLMVVCKDMLVSSPTPSTNTLELSPTNIRPSSECSYPYSTNSSGRASPIINEVTKEEEEEKEGESKENITPISTPSITSRHQLSPLVTSPSSLTPKDNTNLTAKSTTNNKINKVSMSTAKPINNISSTKPSISKSTTSLKSSSTNSTTTKSTHNSVPFSKPNTSDASSLQRRKQGGGLKRTLSLYQENKRQVQMSKDKKTTTSAVVRRQSNATSNNKSTYGNGTGSNSPKLLPSNNTVPSQEDIPTMNASIPLKETILVSNLGAGFAASQHSSRSKTQNANNSPSLSSHEILHTVPHSLTNSTASSIPGTPPILDTLTPPTYSVDTRGGGTSRHNQTMISTSSDAESVSVSCSDNEGGMTCSDIDEDIDETRLREMSKEQLITELIRTQTKLKNMTQELNDTRSYLDSLLAKVMDQNPELLINNNQ